MKYRAMPPEKALDLLHGLFDRYASRAAIFESVDNILPREYLADVLPRLETPEGVALFYEIKADLKEREMATLAQARVTRIQPGIEALSTTTLKLMRKGTTSFQNLKFLKNCARYGVTAFWNLLVGFPGEPEEVYRKYYDDLPLLTHLQPPSGVYPIRFDRFSPYHTQAKEYGLKLKPSKFYEMIYPFPPEELAELAYFFADEDYRAAYITQTARWLGKLRDRVAVWQLRAKQHDQRLKPELTVKMRHGEPVVYDSRSGAAVEHRPSAQGWRVLALLEDQHRVPRLVQKLGLPASEVEAEVATFRRQGLLFEEDGYLLSLVQAESAPALPLVHAAAALQSASVA
jgi:ribosomal peptide maturation radical SAM protein 1